MITKLFHSKLNIILLIILIIIISCLVFFGRKAQAPFNKIEQVKTNNIWQDYPLTYTVGYHSCGDLIGGIDCLPESTLKKVLGNKDDLIAFSILPSSKVHGILSYQGMIEGGYFFEGNILINILSTDKKVLKRSNGIAKSEWMTTGPVKFEGNIDFSGLTKGPAYLEIHNDNASGLPKNDKSILIPIIIE